MKVDWKTGDPQETEKMHQTTIISEADPLVDMVAWYRSIRGWKWRHFPGGEIAWTELPEKWKEKKNDD